jgi:hypothetical protein
MSEPQRQPLSVLAYMDIVLIVLAAPIMLLIGVPAAGYLAGAGVWIAFRALGVVVDRYAATARDPNQATAIKLGYMLGRLFTLAIAVIVVTNATSRDGGLACLLVIVFAFTVALATSALTRPASKRPRNR